MTWPLAMGCAAWAGILAALGAHPAAAAAVGVVVLLLCWAALDG